MLQSVEDCAVCVLFGVQQSSCDYSFPRSFKIATIHILHSGINSTWKMLCMGEAMHWRWGVFFLISSPGVMGAF